MPPKNQTSPTNIEVDKTTLGRVLKARRLVVPGFQREYSWHPKRVKKLYSDFQAAMKRDQESYFLGTIVLQNTSPPGLIDGQQRLATTCFFLAAVRDAYLELGVVFATSSLLVGTAVAASGSVGYVGLIVPHLVRLVIGSDNRLVIPFSALAGAIFVVSADTIARTAIAPRELPVGAITALIGAPLFIYLLRRS